MGKETASDREDVAPVEVIKLSRRDSEAFVEALLNPSPPNERLVESVRRYREAVAVGRPVSVDMSPPPVAGDEVPNDGD